MAFTDINPEISRDPSPVTSLLKIVASVLIGISIVFILLLLFYASGGIGEVSQLSVEELKRNEIKWQILIIQGIASLGMFIGASLIYIYHFERKDLSILNVPGRLSMIGLILTALIGLSFMPLNTWIIDWNQNISFPQFLKGFENWSKEKEESAERIIKAITNIHSFPYFVLCFVVIAIIAGIGEELLFRGLLQNKLVALFKNHHLAIIATAIIFSAIHIQFYGFVPRMLLGVIFGYLYYWSKNILIPIFAHILNNGFTVVGLYLYNLKYMEYNIEEATKAPLSIAASSLVITAALLFSFWKFYKEKPLLQ